MVTADCNKEWVRKFYCLQTNNHLFYEVENWDDFTKFNDKWDVAFVDHSPGERRHFDILRLKSNCKWIVVHDTDQSTYDYEQSFNMFKYRRDIKVLKPYTTIISDFEDPNLLY